MQTLEQLAAQNTAFKDAFNEDSAPPTSDDAMSEDQRFGITGEDAQMDAGGDSGAVDVASVMSEEEPPAEPAADPAAAEAMPMEGGEADPMASADPMAAEGEGAVAPPADPVPVPADMASADEAAVDAPPAMSYQDAVQRMSEDFGPEFVDMVRVIAAHHASEAGGKAASEAVGSVKSEIEEAIDSINQAFATQHFEAISEAHDDFMEIVAKPEFESWVASMPESEQNAMRQVIAGGTARQVIAMLKQFKEQGAAEEDPTGMDELDAAAGVRSGGGGPTAPMGGARLATGDEYADAWTKA